MKKSATIEQGLHDSTSRGTRAVRFKETENKRLVARGCGRGENGKLLFYKSPDFAR